MVSENVLEGQFMNTILLKKSLEEYLEILEQQRPSDQSKIEEVEGLLVDLTEKSKLPGDKDGVRVIYSGELSRLEAGRNASQQYLTVANLKEIGEDAISDTSPIGDVVLRDEEGNHYDLDYEVVLVPLSLKEVAARSGQKCHPHGEWDCSECAAFIPKSRKKST